MTVKEIDELIASKTTLIYSLANIQEGYVRDIQSLMKTRDILTKTVTRKVMYKFDIKKNIEALYKLIVSFRKNLNEHYKDNEQFKLAFGESTDNLQESIEELIKEKVKWK